MADSKISALTAITTLTPATDVLPVVDVTGTTKKITTNQILGSGGTATLASATITGDLTVDTSTLKVDSANNRVGIGTATPNWLLTASGSSPEFVMIDSGANGTRLYTKTTNTAVFIGSNYSTSAVPINFTLDGGSSNAMTLNSTGLTMSTGSLNSQAWYGINATSMLSSGSGSWPLLFGINGVEAMRLNTTANLVLKGGTVGASGVGVTFPATQVASSDANCLDDYEEGTFTPTIVGATTAGTGVYTAQNGRYTKIGNLVTFQVFVDWTAHTGTGNMRIGNLPFTNGANFWAGSIGYLNNIALTAGYIMTGYVEASQSYVTLQQYPTGGGATSGVPIDTAGSIMFSGSYTV
jgi:hypothetical protein